MKQRAILRILHALSIYDFLQLVKYLVEKVILWNTTVITMSQVYRNLLLLATLHLFELLLILESYTALECFLRGAEAKGSGKSNEDCQ